MPFLRTRIMRCNDAFSPHFLQDMIVQDVPFERNKLPKTCKRGQVCNGGPALCKCVVEKMKVYQ